MTLNENDKQLSQAKALLARRRGRQRYLKEIAPYLDKNGEPVYHGETVKMSTKQEVVKDGHVR